MRRYPLITAAIFALAVPAAHADIWKSVDAQGHVTYSDRWSPGATRVREEDRPAAERAQAADEQKELAATNKQITDELNKEQAERSVKKDEDAAHAQQCTQAKIHYQDVIQARRLYKMGENGDKQFLSDDEAEKERTQAREDMDKACGTGE